MKKEELKIAINGWIGEQVIRIMNRIDPDIEDAEVVTLFDIFIWILIYSIPLLMLAYVGHSLYVELKPILPTLDQIINFIWEIIIHLVIVALVIGTGILIVSILENVGFYSKTKYEKRTKRRKKK